MTLDLEQLETANIRLETTFSKDIVVIKFVGNCNRLDVCYDFDAITKTLLRDQGNYVLDFSGATALHEHFHFHIYRFIVHTVMEQRKVVFIAINGIANPEEEKIWSRICHYIAIRQTWKPVDGKVGFTRLDDAIKALQV